MQEQWLLAEAVTREQQPLAVRVPQCEREHSAQAIDDAFAPLAVRGKDDLGVGPCREGMSAPLQLGAQGVEVVDLAVEDDRQAAVRVVHGLPAAVEVENRQSLVSKGDTISA